MNQKTPFDILNGAHAAGFDNTDNSSNVLSHESDAESDSNGSYEDFLINSFLQQAGFTSDQGMMPQTSNGSDMTQEEIDIHALLNNDQVQYNFNGKQEELKYASVPALLNENQFQQEDLCNMPSTSMPSASMPSTSMASTSMASTSMASTSMPSTSMTFTPVTSTSMVPTSMAVNSVPSASMAFTPMAPTPMAPTSMAVNSMPSASMAFTPMAPTPMAPTSMAVNSMPSAPMAFTPMTSTSMAPTSMAVNSMPSASMASTSMPATSMPAQVAPFNLALPFFNAPPTLYPVQGQPAVRTSPYTPPQMPPQMPVQQFNQLPMVLPLPMCPPAVVQGFASAMVPPIPNGTPNFYDPGVAPSSSKKGKRKTVSVASEVSLKNCQPRLLFNKGIKYVCFSYTEDRQGKPYYVRADVEGVSLDVIPMDIREKNTIYREALNRETYKGHRFEYEEACNFLAWKLCYLNRDLMFDNKGLTQRSVDAYRGLHDNTKSRRILRMEKILNGTLRKRSPKKRKKDEEEKKN